LLAFVIHDVHGVDRVMWGRERAGCVRLPALFCVRFVCLFACVPPATTTHPHPLPCLTYHGWIRETLFRGTLSFVVYTMECNVAPPISAFLMRVCVCVCVFS
jgi:hypothetical protein